MEPGGEGGGVGLEAAGERVQTLAGTGTDLGHRFLVGLAGLADLRIGGPDLGQGAGLVGIGGVVRALGPHAAVIHLRFQAQIVGVHAGLFGVVGNLALGHGEQRAGIESAHLHDAFTPQAAPSGELAAAET